MTRSLILMLVAPRLLTGCIGDSDPATPHGSRVLAPLVDLAPLARADDPLADHRPEQVTCSSLTGWYPEDGGLEVSTGSCDYLALTEPAAVAARAGETVTSQIRHLDLTSEEPSWGHVALLVNGRVAWERTIEIPGDGNVLDVSFQLSEDVNEGDPLGIHLHNHGQNTWTFTPWTVSE